MLETKKLSPIMETNCQKKGSLTFFFLLIFFQQINDWGQKAESAFVLEQLRCYCKWQRL